ncbi:MAG TPA: 30S ribosome-binding factor RbfA [Chloroflexi bacterium]|mgnify:CR=1 FL=1|nr:30S ribosome-binding factor RbfA [Anaerolineaceae bacterium]HHX08040.1 30S ribosome-binding factor RbfA [Chloroflexota bacterium]
MPSKLRMKRINDRMKEILSMVLLAKIEDPRLLGVSVTDVKVDRELDYANIYVSALEGQERSQEVIEALNHARKFLRYEISQEIDLRVTPKLRFFWDPTPEKAARIDLLLAEWQNEEHPVFDDDAEEDLGDYGDEVEEDDFYDEDEEEV